MRLDKMLADMNLGSRKELKGKIRKGAARVNGVVVTDPGALLTGDEALMFEGRAVAYHTFAYYMMNKPAGVITATEDPRQQTVLDLLGQNCRRGLSPVGRLDKDTVGLLLLTNDGVLSHRLLSPRRHVDKTYRALIQGRVTAADVAAFAAGLKVDESLTALPAKLEILSYADGSAAAVRPGAAAVRAAAAGDRAAAPGGAAIQAPDTAGSESGAASHTWVHVTIREGKFHQIKRMFLAVGKEVVYLQRLTMGPLTLDDTLAEGAYRPLRAEEIAALRALS